MIIMMIKLTVIMTGRLKIIIKTLKL